MPSATTITRASVDVKISRHFSIKPDRLYRDIKDVFSFWPEHSHSVARLSWTGAGDEIEDELARQFSLSVLMVTGRVAPSRRHQCSLLEPNHARKTRPDLNMTVEVKGMPRRGAPRGRDATRA